MKPPRQVPMPWDRAFEPGPDKHLGLESDDFDLTSLPPDCVAIPLTNGGYTLVEEEDLCRVDEYNWFKVKGRNLFYAAVRMKFETGAQIIFMHRHLFGLSKEDKIQVDHRNHDGLDNRRSFNLRLATSAQNLANARKLIKTASKYRGVSWDTRRNKWLAQITRTRGTVKKRFPLGWFAVEAEAAYAFQMAAPLLKDPDFLQLEEIPPGELPDTERLEEIRRNTIAKVKAALAGATVRLNKTSSYHGVSYNSREGKWAAGLKIGAKRRVRVGMYDVEQEAAYAYNCAVSIQKLTGRKTNTVAEADLSSPARAAKIRAEVTTWLESLRTGEKVNPRASSRYRGASFDNRSGKWKSTARVSGRLYQFGSFDTDFEAAIVYNVSVEILGGPRLKPNPIPAEAMPSAEVMESIRQRVAATLDRYQRGATNRGSTGSRSKLTDEKVIEIRRRAANGEKSILLAAEFDVSQSNICAILKRKSWCHLP